MNDLELRAKLYQKLWAVMKDIGYIQKDKKHTKGWSYASERIIKERVQASFLEHKVLFMPKDSHLEPRIEGLGRDKYLHATTLKLSFQFMDVDTGYAETGALHGMGTDDLDKGIYKAITGALKYVLTGTFMIATGDDPENEEISGEREQQREEKKQAKAGYQKFTKEEIAQARAEQQAIAQGKIAQLEAGTLPSDWDWRISIPRYEKYEAKYGKPETAIALQLAGYRSLEEIPSRAAANAAFDAMKATLLQAKEQPAPAAAEQQRAKPESKLEHAAAPLEALMKEVLHGTFKTRFDAIQKQKEALLEMYGPKDGERLYFKILDEHSGHIDTHANEIAKSGPQSEAVARDLWLELHPEAVEEVTA